jgi:hypothetical protein
MKTINTFNRIYKVTHLLNRKDEYSILDKLNDEIQSEVSKFVDSIIIGELDDLTSIVIMNEYDFDKFNKLSNRTGIKYIIYDLTESVILSELNFESEIQNNIIIPFLEKNLTSDIILDKINIKGVDSLTKIEKRILEMV